MIGKKISVRREPMTNSQMLFAIAACIFVAMYLLAMLVWGGGFLRAQKLFDILNDNAPLIIVACGLTVVMITGGIDISVGGVIALTVMVCVVHMNNGGTPLTALLIALGIGLAFGIAQGFLVSVLEIQPFIVTLAGMFFSRGLTTIVSVQPQKVLNESFLALKDTKIEIPFLGYVAKNGNLIPAKMEIGVVVALLIVAVVYFILKKTSMGRNFYAIGGNRQSALMLGCNVRRMRFYAYIISGILSGIAGYVFMMHTAAGNATNAAGLEMKAIAASIIGGTLLSGGVGNVLGTLFGVLILSTISNIVTASGLTKPWWQSITTGAMLCFFILLQSVVISVRGKRAKKRVETST